MTGVVMYNTFMKTILCDIGSVLLHVDFDRAFETVDCILTPVSPCLPFRLGEKMADPLQMYLLDIFTASVNLAGLPGISLPCGYNREGLPLGMQLLAKPFDEETVVRAAYAYESRTKRERRRPQI